MSDQHPAIPAGWYPDPAGSAGDRWWDGQRWTEHLTPPRVEVPQAPAAPPHTDPALLFGGTPRSVPYAIASATPRAQAGAPVYTGAVWAIVAVNLLVPGIVITVLTVAAVGSNAPLTSNAGVVSTVNTLPLLTYGVSVLLAYLDHRMLVRGGVPSPFHWAFAFINTAVYLIGRGLVMKRRTGRGMATFWIGLVPVGLIVLGVIASVVIPVVLALRN